jgi:hypothetical protein
MYFSILKSVDERCFGGLPAITIPQNGAFNVAECLLILAKKAHCESLFLHIFLDCSVVEVFANYRLCMSSRVYPSRSDSMGVGVFGRGGSARVKVLNVWEMESIKSSL